MLTLSHRAQVRRFTADLVRVLKGQPGKQLSVDAFPEAYGTFNSLSLQWWPLFYNGGGEILSLYPTSVS